MGAEVTCDVRNFSHTLNPVKTSVWRDGNPSVPIIGETVLAVASTCSWRRFFRGARHAGRLTQPRSPGRDSAEVPLGARHLLTVGGENHASLSTGVPAKECA